MSGDPCARWRSTNRRRRARPGYTMMPVTLVSTKRVLALTTAAKRLFAYSHVKWRKGRPIVLAVRHTAETIGLRTETVAAALAELIAAGLVERVREHVPPGKTRPPRAAEYRLVHREGTAYRPNEQQPRTGVFAVLDPGDAIRSGYIKMLTEDLMHCLTALPDAEFELLWQVAFRDQARDQCGAIFRLVPLKLSDVQVMIPNMPPRTLRHAARSLIGRRLCVETITAAGRRSMEIAPAGSVANGLPWKSKTTLSNNGRYTDAPVLPATPSKSPETGSSFRLGATQPSLSAKREHSEEPKSAFVGKTGARQTINGCKTTFVAAA